METIVQILRGVLNLGRDLFVGLAGALGLGEYGAGVLTGVLVSGIAGFLLFRLNIWMRNARAPFQPQRVVHMTAQTPAQVVGSGLGNTLKVAGVLVVALTVVLLAAGLAWPGDAAITAAAGILMLLFGGIIS